jgi:hypothetical protein
MLGLIELVSQVQERRTMKYGIEAGRTITVDRVPSVYLNIVTDSMSSRYAMVPADADDLAGRIVALLNRAEQSK